MCVLYTHIWKTSLKSKMKLICGNEEQLNHGGSSPGWPIKECQQILQFPACIISLKPDLLCSPPSMICLNYANPKVHTFRCGGRMELLLCTALPLAFAAFTSISAMARFLFLKLSKQSFKARLQLSVHNLEARAYSESIVELKNGHFGKFKKLHLFPSPKHLFDYVNNVVKEFISKGLRWAFISSTAV